MQAEATTPVTAPVTEQVAAPVAQPNEMSVDRCKVYKYKKNNGKFITVKRSWKNIGEKEAKLKQLNDYFENDANIDRSKTIQALYKDYNSKQTLKISYSMFYKRYVEHFGAKNH